MPNGLSQTEIDSLLCGLERPSVRSSPAQVNSKLDATQFQFFRRLHSKLADDLESAWSTLTTTDVEVELDSITELSYQQVTSELASSVVATIETGLASGEGLVALSVEIAFAIVQQMLGGDLTDWESPNRLTEVELKLAARAMAAVVNSYRKLNERLNLAALDAVTNEIPRVALTPDEGSVICLTLAVVIYPKTRSAAAKKSYTDRHKLVGQCRLVWPVEFAGLFSETKSDLRQGESIRVELPPFQIPEVDLKVLSVGQLIETQIDASSHVRLVSGEQTIGIAELGTLDGYKAVRILGDDS